MKNVEIRMTKQTGMSKSEIQMSKESQNPIDKTCSQYRLTSCNSFDICLSEFVIVSTFDILAPLTARLPRCSRG